MTQAVGTDLNPFPGAEIRAVIRRRQADRRNGPIGQSFLLDQSPALSRSTSISRAAWPRECGWNPAAFRVRAAHQGCETDARLGTGSVAGIRPPPGSRSRGGRATRGVWLVSGRLLASQRPCNASPSTHVASAWPRRAEGMGKAPYPFWLKAQATLGAPASLRGKTIQPGPAGGIIIAAWRLG